MKFFAVLSTAFLAASSVLADITPTQVVSNINSLATTSANLKNTVQGLDIVTVLLEGSSVANGLNNIATTVVSVTQTMTGPAFVDSDAKLVVQALNNFVAVHQALLSTIIGQHGLLSLFGFAEPIRLALVAIESGVDTFAYALIKLIPTQTDPATNDHSSLDNSLNQAIAAYAPGGLEL
jgi:hypothetical protein